VKWSTFWDNFIVRYGGPRDDSQTENVRLCQTVSDLTLNKLMRPGDRVVEYTGVLGSLSFIKNKLNLIENTVRLVGRELGNSKCRKTL